jgi:homocysteine S-methyltransferase
LEEEDIKIPAWFSFNSKDGVNVVSGDSILKCASIAESCKKVVAVGINCTPPRFIRGLILSIKKVSSLGFCPFSGFHFLFEFYS